MLRLLLTVLLTCFLLAAAGPTVLFDPTSPQTGPFPNDSLTIPDPLQKTGLRLNLPLPPCASQYTSCQETGLLEQIDGFSLRARATVSFSAPVDLSTVPSGIFFVALNELTGEETGVNQNGDIIAIDQAVYDPTTNTLYAKPFSALDQHRRYALIVTDAVHDTAGNAVVSDPAYTACLASADPYCASLAQTLTGISSSVAPRKIVAASTFTTMSATSWLERARAILPYIPPTPVLVTPAFSIPNLTGLVLHEQTGSNPVTFSDLALPVTSGLLSGLGTLVMGWYQSPSFLESDQSIRPYPSLPDLPVPTETNQVWFNVLLPATPEPPGGYPVVIFGHGFGDSRWGGPTAVAPALARSGMAVIAINAVGHGFGPLSTVSLMDNQGNMNTINAGGRGIDLNSDGVIGSEEGCALTTPIAYGTRDCFRQTVVDLMQLVRIVQQGLDLNGDGKPDLDAGHLYYGGESLGAIYGTMLTALEPTVRAAALNVGGASVVDIARWSPAYTSLSDQALGDRIPSLLNAGNGYNQDYVLPGQPVHVITVPGSLAIQNVFETLEWLGMQGDPMAFVTHLKLSPLPGARTRPVLMQFARLDMTVTNPANSALIRAGGLLSSTWEYRHDLARPLVPDLPVDPHPFLVFFVSLGSSGIQLPGLAGLAISLDAQQQIAGFLAADGASIPDPNNLSRALLGIRVFQQPSVLPFDFGY